MIDVRITRTRRRNNSRLPFRTDEDVGAVRLLDHFAAVGIRPDVRQAARISGRVARGSHRIKWRWLTRPFTVTLLTVTLLTLTVTIAITIRIVTRNRSVGRLRCLDSIVLWLGLSLPGGGALDLRFSLGPFNFYFVYFAG